MAREFFQLPDGVQFENKYVQQIIAALMGLAGDGTDAQLAGIPIRATAVDDDSLFAVSIRNRGSGGKHLQILSADGLTVLGQVTDQGVLWNAEIGTVKMWHGLSADIPYGWVICDGTNGTPDLRDRFVMGAGSTYALNATGGAATINLEHTHVQDPHAHSHDHDMDHDHDTNIDHSHGTIQSEPASTGGNNDDESAPVAGTGQTISLQPHEHDVIIPSYDVDPRTSSAPEPDALTDVDATATTAVNQNAGSTTQSVLNPYFALFFIKRVAV